MITFGQARKRFWGWLGRSGSGFWSDVMRLFKFPVMALRVLTIYPQDFPHSTSEFLAWPLCHCHSCLWEQTQTLYCSLKEPMSSGPCLHASLCHSPWCFLYSSQSSSTRTWSSFIKSMSLHMLVPPKNVVSGSTHLGITVPERSPDNTLSPSLSHHTFNHFIKCINIWNKHG